MTKIDIFTHILPVKYKDALYNVLDSKFTKSFQDAIPTLFDLDLRFRIMDKFDGLTQVLTMPMPLVENIKDLKSERRKL